MNERAVAAALRRSEGMASVADRPRKRSHPRLGRKRVPATVTVRGIPTAVRAAGGSGDGVAVGGYASVTESPYEMCDMFGPYTEVVSRGAFAATLAADPLVEFTLNHGKGGGMPMAHTRNATLTLSEDETGLSFDAMVDPSRNDVADMLKAMERGDLCEASFKFSIVDGLWSPDFTQFRINQVDLDRGDVSAVNFGANPAASSGLRSITQETETPAPVAPVKARLLFDDKPSRRLLDI